MRRCLPACLGASLVLAAFAPDAFSHPPERARSARSGVRSTAASRAAAAAYLSGKQELVGSHAPSSDPIPRDSTGRPMLALKTLNRSEFLAIPASSDDGGFASADLDRVAHLLRAAGGEEYPIDPRVLSLVYRIEMHFGVPEIRIVSGYRVPRPQSHSNHGTGRAVDLVVPGTPDEDVAAFVRDAGFVGVGIYPSSRFVHVDVRPRSYFWVDFSGPHMRNREHALFADLAAKSDAAALAGGAVPVEPFGIATDVDAALHARGFAPAPADVGAEDDGDVP